MADISDNLDEELWLTAHALADAARGAILPHFRATGLDAENKEAGGFDPVTVADHAAETAMREVLAQRRPQDGILGEEQGIVEGTSGLTWVLDPIDGTRGFLSGTPTWGVLIALSDESGPRLGVIDQPYTGERFCGGLGRESALELLLSLGGRLSVSLPLSLSRSVSLSLCLSSS